MKLWMLLMGALLCATVVKVEAWSHYWPVEIDGKWGYIDDQGRIVIPPQFDSLGGYVGDGGTRVRIGTKWGIIHRDSSAAVPAEYDYIGDDGNVPARLRQDTLWSLWVYGFDSRSLQPIAGVDSLGRCTGGYTPAYKKGRCGLINTAGAFVVPAVYEVLQYAYYCPKWGRSDVLWFAKRDGKWGVITGHDSVLVPFCYDGISPGKKAFHAVEVAGHWGFVDNAGIMRIAPTYDSARGFEPGWDRPSKDAYGFGKPVAAVCSQGHWGFIDTTGHDVVPLRYDAVGSVSNRLTPVCRKGKWGYIGRDGRLAIPAKYDSVGTMYAYGIVKVRRKYGFINEDGSTRLKPQFDAVIQEFPLFDLVQKDGKWGFVSQRGDPQLLGWYDAAWPFDEGRAYVKDHGRWKYIDTHGTTVWPKADH